MERNYHIFYMLAAGASPEQRESWAMGDLETHQFTSQSGCYDRRDGVLDSDLFTELMEAFRVMGFEEEEKASIHRVFWVVWLPLGFVVPPSYRRTQFCVGVVFKGVGCC